MKKRISAYILLVMFLYLALTVSIACASDLCKEYFQKKEFDKAIGACTEDIKEERGDLYKRLMYRGSSYVSKGMYGEKADNNTVMHDYFDEAISDFSEALKLRPYSYEAYNGRGIAYYKNANYTEALADFNRAVKIAPDFIKAQKNLKQAGIMKEKQDRLTQPNKFHSTFHALTMEMYPINVVVSLTWRADPDKVIQVSKKIGNEPAGINSTVVKPNIRDIVSSVMAGYRLVDLIKTDPENSSVQINMTAVAKDEIKEMIGEKLENNLKTDNLLVVDFDILKMTLTKDDE